MRLIFFGLSLCLNFSISAQIWYLDIKTGSLISSMQGGERFQSEALLAVGKGDAQDIAEQLPHALDAYGIDYDYHEEGLIVYTATVYKAWRLMKAGEDIQATLSMLLLADLFGNIRSIQARVVGSLLRTGFRTSGQASKLWRLPAIQRGVEIEAAIAGPNRLPYGFPVVDEFNGIVATSIKSVDLTLSSYRSSKLFYRCKSYVDKLIDFSGAQRRGVIVPRTAEKELKIVIPKGRATESQRKILDEVIDYGKLNDVNVRIIDL
ncbi:MAG: hypothetical protein KDD19_17340 [Phaeodactylibacter sp.]|nr:hypothetical protein [Phaeodactylibacter sp.]